LEFVKSISTVFKKTIVSDVPVAGPWKLAQECQDRRQAIRHLRQSASILWSALGQLYWSWRHFTDGWHIPTRFAPATWCNRSHPFAFFAQINPSLDPAPTAFRHPAPHLVPRFFVAVLSHETRVLVCQTPP
jgi:hypothetical protein